MDFEKERAEWERGDKEIQRLFALVSHHTDQANAASAKIRELMDKNLEITDRMKAYVNRTQAN